MSGLLDADAVLRDFQRQRPPDRQFAGAGRQLVEPAADKRRSDVGDALAWMESRIDALTTEEPPPPSIHHHKKPPAGRGMSSTPRHDSSSLAALADLEASFRALSAQLSSERRRCASLRARLQLEAGCDDAAVVDGENDSRAPPPPPPPVSARAAVAVRPSAERGGSAS